jgi:AcrR family transcriptional regulator
MDSEDDGARSFDLLWGGRERPSRGPKPELSLDAVVQGAMRVADAQGLEALSMARVAAALGVTTMALYRYVPAKTQLVDLMIDSALGAPPAPEGRDWRSEISLWAGASLARLHARPWLLESVMRRAPIGPNWLAWLNAALRALSESGLAESEMMAAVMLIDGHVRATAQLSLGPAATQRWPWDFRRALDMTRSDPRYAALARVADAGGFSAPAEDPFEFGLQRLLDGIEAHVRKRRTRPRDDAGRVVGARKGRTKKRR